MKDYCSVQNSGLGYWIWIICCVILTRNVECYLQASTPGYSHVGGPCVPGQEGILDNHALDIVLSWMPDEFKNPDEICVTHLGSGAALCRERYDGNYSSICGGMWCRDPLLDICTLVAPNDGVPCADQKWCYGGECRYSDQVSSNPESCPFGDTKSFSSGGLSCQELVSRDRKRCYDVITEQMCCQSCRAVSMNRLGCRYGDRTDGCQQEDCFLMTIDQLGTCCQTCGFLIEIIPTQPPATTRNIPSTSRTTASPVSTTSRTTRTPGPRVTTSKTGGTTTSGSAQTTKSQQTTIRGQQTTTQGQQTTIRGQQTTTQGQQTTIRGQQTTTQGPQTTTRGSQTTSKQQLATTTGGRTTMSSTKAQQSQTTPSITSQRTSTSSSTGTDTTVVTSNTQPVTSTVSQASDTTTQNNFGAADAQQANQNVVAIGTGVGVGCAVLLLIVIITVYIIKKRVSASRTNNPPNDNDSVGGDSISRLTSDMNATSTTWYPNYRATHMME